MILYTVTGLLLWLGFTGLFSGHRAQDLGTQTIGLILIGMALAFYFGITGAVE